MKDKFAKIDRSCGGNSGNTWIFAQRFHLGIALSETPHWHPSGELTAGGGGHAGKCFELCRTREPVLPTSWRVASSAPVASQLIEVGGKALQCEAAS